MSSTSLPSNSGTDVLHTLTSAITKAAAVRAALCRLGTSRQTCRDRLPIKRSSAPNDLERRFDFIFVYDLLNSTTGIVIWNTSEQPPVSRHFRKDERSGGKSLEQPR